MRECPSHLLSYRGLACVVPEFGGGFLDSTGVVNVYLTDLRASQRLREALRFALRGEPERPIRFCHGEFSIRQLRSFSDALLPYLGRGVVYSGPSERINGLTIGYATEEARARIEAGITRSGLPRRAVVLERTDYGSVSPSLGSPDRCERLYPSARVTPAARAVAGP